MVLYISIDELTLVMLSLNKDIQWTTPNQTLGTNLEWTVSGSLVIADGKFNFPQGFLCIGHTYYHPQGLKTQQSKNTDYFIHSP